MTRPSNSIRKANLGRRRGFAIVLVAAMAGLVFLLGTSLVVTSQLQTQAARYNQNLRLARENARSALDMAVSDLQRYASKDKLCTFESDIERAGNYDEDFNDPSPPSVSGLENAFWTGVRASGSTTDNWLVTRPRVAEFDSTGGVLAVPDEDYGTNSITMVGPGSANVASGGDQLLFNVKVPKEEIRVFGVDGIADPADNHGTTIGHYAYWVGDLGTKASYAIYDKSSQVNYGVYSDSNVRSRLNDLRMRGPTIPGFDPSASANAKDNDTSSNPARIDAFMNDFQFRFKNPDTDESYLATLLDTYRRYHFHDFTPLSVGLLTNSLSGGLRKDLSPFLPSGLGTTYDAEFRGFLNVPKQAIDVDLTVPDDPVYAMGARQLSTVDGVSMEARQAIVPALTEFNLNASVFVELDNSVPPKATSLRISFNGGFELWNPYTAKIDAEALQFRVVGLPKLAVWFADPKSEGPVWVGDLFPEGDGPVFTLPSTVGGDSFWRGGEVYSFSGGSSLVAGTKELASTSVRISKMLKSFDPTVSAPNVLYLDFPINLDSPYGRNDNVDIEIEVYSEGVDLHDAVPDVPIAVYRIGRTFSINPSVVKTDPAVESIDFGFYWGLRDSALWSVGVEDVEGVSSDIPAFYHPNRFDIDGRLASEDFDSVSNKSDSLNVNPRFEDASLFLLAMHPVSISDEDAHLLDIPLLELPLRELSSVAQLSGAYTSSTGLNISGGPTPKIGRPMSPNNSAFDEAFFSTIPSGGGTFSDGWEIGDVLPNSSYVIGKDLVGYQPVSVDSAKGLQVRGGFNVNSTSIESWKALLKANDTDNSARWSGLAPDGTFLFFNFPQSADLTFTKDFKSGSASELAKRRYSFRQGVVALSESQVDALATAIVENIRRRAQGVPLDYEVTPNYGAGNKGPFVSLEDFLDSGVLQNAIDEVDIERDVDGNLVLDGDGRPVYKDDAERVNPSWVVHGSAREFTQATIMNLIGPYVSVRSDTFLVRAYGDASDPSDSSKVWARAYCEAVVQRTAEKHETESDQTTFTPTSNPDETDEFGRKFKIVAFRWLDADEI